jgi:hypothetical protein
MTAYEQDLAVRTSIAAKVEVYGKAQVKIQQAYTLLADAQKELKAAFSIASKYDSDFDVIPKDRYCYEIAEIPSTIEGMTRRKAWEQLYYALEIDKIMSIKRVEEVHQKLESDELPEITLENIFDVFQTLVQNTGNFTEEMIAEVYDWLRPSDRSFASEYKTNQKNAKFELGKKVILPWTVERGWTGGKFRVNYHREKNLIALDKVFHLLDGKSMMTEGYRSPLVDKINDGAAEGETDYFSFKCYGNNNLHLEFKRMDLVKEFNRIAGGMNLKPSNN